MIRFQTYLLLATSFLFAAMLLLIPDCMAQDVSNWAADKVKLENILRSDDLDKEEQCHDTWNILWPWAKMGQPEARAKLALLLLPFPHGQGIILPGRSNSENNLRDGTIVLLHTLGMKLPTRDRTDLAPQEYFYQISLLYMADESLAVAFPEIDRSLFQDESLLKCTAFQALLQHPVQECVQHIVENNQIPTFEQFSEEIDRSIANGESPKCNF